MRMRLLPLCFVIVTIAAGAVLANPPPLKRVNLSASSAVCNDGTPGAFYMRQSQSGSNVFIIHLQGGWWCWDAESCMARAKSSPNMVSSKTFPEQYTIGGMFSPNITQGTIFEDANALLIAYCSSDAWSGIGAKANFQGQDWIFSGRNVVRETLKVLIAQYGLNGNSTVIFSGCSAGGQGVINVVDYVSEFLSSTVPGAEVLGLADAGWMMQVNKFRKDIVSIKDQFIAGVQNWQPPINQACAFSNQGAEYTCLFSPVAAKYIKTPTLVQAMQYDTFQLPYQCCAPPFNHSGEVQWREMLRKTFQVTLESSPLSTYSPACWSHCMTEDSNLWQSIMINGQTLGQVLESWILDPQHKRVSLIDACVGFNCSEGCPRV